MTSPTLPAHASAFALLAVAAITLYPVFELGAQTPPARPTRPAPVTAPTPAPAPAAKTIHIDPWINGWADFDHIKIDAAFAAEQAKFAANAALANIDMKALSAQASALALANVDMKGISAQAMAAADHALATMGGFAAIAPQPPVAPRFKYEFDASDRTWVTGGRRELPSAWAPEDPADSLYREARKALSSDSYRRAAELFRKIRDQYPRSTYTPDAPYWEAFALARIGAESDLRSAKDALEWQSKQFPKASTRGDASALSTRIDGALARRGDQQAYGNLVTTVNQATSQGCPRDSEDERVAALNALARMDTAAVIPTLKKVLARREPCTQALRRTAVWLYASRRIADAPSVLMNVARTDPDREVREQAVFWMANVPSDEAATMLIDLAKNGNDLELRKRAVYALSRSKSSRAATTLREIATDAGTPTELRSDALSHYFNGPGKEDANAMSFLKDVYGRADEQNFRNRVLSVIANRKNDDARNFLADVAQNNRETIETRRYALSALSNAGANPTQLIAIYDRSSEVELKRGAIGVLASLRDNAGIDKLLDIARNEKNAQLKAHAVSYLSRTKDPRALQLLQEIILK